MLSRIRGAVNQEKKWLEGENPGEEVFLFFTLSCLKLDKKKGVLFVNKESGLPFVSCLS